MDNSRAERFTERLKGIICLDDEGNEISLEERLKQKQAKKAQEHAQQRTEETSQKESLQGSTQSTEQREAHTRDASQAHAKEGAASLKRPWRPPTTEQDALEKQMSALILKFLKSGKVSGKDYTVSQDAKDKLEQDLAQLLQQARELGAEYGTAMTKHQEAVSAKKIAIGVGLAYFLKRAKDVAVGLVQRVRDVLSNNNATPDDAQEAMDSLFDSLPDTVATTEIHSEVEDAVLETLKSNGIEQIEWICEPGACETCLDNEDAGPIDITDAFPSGDQNPPAHPRCRCVTMIPLKDESV